MTEPRSMVTNHLRFKSTGERLDEEMQKSAPQIRASHNSGEKLPNGDTAGGGADTNTVLRVGRAE